MHLTWQRRGGGLRSGERERECGKEAAARAALKGDRGELVAAARLWRAGRTGGGGSVAMDGREEAVARAERRQSAEETRSPFEKTQLSVVSARRARTT